MSKSKAIVTIGGILYLVAGAWVASSQVKRGVSVYLRDGKTLEVLRDYLFAILSTIAFLITGAAFLFYGVG